MRGDWMEQGLGIVVRIHERMRKARYSTKEEE